MKNLPFQIHLVALGAFIFLNTTRCQKQSTMNQKVNDLNSESIFPKGALGSPETFTGNAWHYGLVENDSTLTTIVGNVYFEPGARSHWHTHPAGQILIITDGEGYHQIKGQPRQTLKKGDVVTCPPNVLHWHGAVPNKGMHQLYIVPNTEKGIVAWQNPVTDDDYNTK